jgi:hypothetical protein
MVVTLASDRSMSQDRLYLWRRPEMSVLPRTKKTEQRSRTLLLSEDVRLSVVEIPT